ncbi:hypothetical protein B566_EDAN011508 [Ephemera danica]|nr:hypothetical protein B566_EDAN011508 [Ephemera danica]
MTAEEVSKMSTTELVAKLTAPCRYDRFQRPEPGEGRPVHVHSRRFTAHILLMFRWRDPRLALPSEARGVNLGANGGQGLLLRDKIWVPHVYLSNERESVVMGAEKKDVRINVHSDGTVQQSLRMKVTLYCLMNLQKFPFDQQQCPLILERTYNTSDLRLSWEAHRPVSVNSQLLLTEYRLIDTRTLSAEQASGHARGLAVEPPHSKLEPPSEVSEAPDADQQNDTTADGVFESDHAVSFNGEDLQFFTETGNFSSLEIRFHLAREVGHYVMDYFMPSILLVVMSWVSFWLDPNAIPGRTTLGTSTMLTFITLTRNTGSSLPKFYIKLH